MPASVATEGAQSGTVAANTTSNFTPYGSSTSVNVGDEILLVFRIGNISATVTSFSDGIPGSQNVWTAKVARFPAPAGFSLTFYTCPIVTAGVLSFSIGLSASVASRWSIGGYIDMSDLMDGHSEGTGTSNAFDSGPMTTASASDTVIGYGGGNTATTTNFTSSTGVTFNLRTASSGLCFICDAFGVPGGTTAEFKDSVSASQAWALGVLALVDADQADAVLPLPQQWIQRKVSRAVLAR